MEKANPFLSEIVNTCEKNAEKVPTLRFTLSLTESNDKSCSEFSFLDLIKKAPADEIKEKTPLEDDEETENLRALAKKFEEKYAPRPRSRKRRRDRVEDLVDVTYGYDETDPFVDDSEAYDELIPADWTTEHGGFYINQGELNFRPASSDESEVDDDFKEVKKVKHKSPKKLPKIPKVKKVKVPGVKKEKKKKIIDKEKKPKKISSVEKVKDKEKKPKKKHVVGNGSVFNQVLSPSPIAKTTVVSPTACSNAATLSSASVLQSTNSGVASNSPPIKLQNTLHLGNQGTLKSEPITVSANGGSGMAGIDGAPNVQSETVTDTASNSPVQNGLQPAEGSSMDSVEPRLPQCLPVDVESCMMRLKKAANDSVDEGKCKFFNSDVNHMLLELETKSRALSSKVRSGIYEFLAFYLPCTKETLLKRAKKLLLTDQAGRLREPMAKLKAAVDRVIPEQVKRFEEEVKRHVEEESQQSDAKLGGENSNDHKKELFKSAMELVEESEKMEDVTTPTDPNAPTLSEDKTKKSVPKRKFLWTDELRELLCAVVQMKLKVFEMSKTRIMSAENYLKQFFDEEVRPLWPKGWMTSRILFKESKQAHGKHTSVPARMYKKAMLPKKQGESSENTDTNAGTTEVKDLPVTIPLLGGVGSSLANTVPTKPPTTITQASSAATNASPLDKPAEVKPSGLVFASALTVSKPVATLASVTKMESTTVNRPEQKPQAVSVIAGLSFAEKDSSQKPSIKTPSLCDSNKMRPVTILDFADIMPAEVKGSSQKLLHSQPALPPQQQMAAFLKKTPPSPKENARDQPFTHLPSALVTTGISPVKQSMTVSSAQTQSTLASPPKIVHSSPVVVQTNSQSGFTAASLVAAIGSGVHNSFIDLSSTIRPQQMPSASAAPQTILDTISPPRRPLDLKSCQAVHPSFSQGLSPQSMSMSLNTAVPTQALHQSQPPNLTLFGSATNLQGKGTTPLTHIGLVPSTAMLHLARQSQEQAGLVLPQNHFNQVLLGMNQSSNQSMPSLQLSHGALLSNQTVYPDPNQTPTTGTHQSAFLPRFS